VENMPVTVAVDASGASIHEFMTRIPVRLERFGK
jgi:tartrate dehydratase beta subunit/fumarate hydratase class I family protein